MFAPGKDFENLVGKAEFNQVSSRLAQAATLKAEKAGETIVDLAAAKGNNGSTSETPTEPDDTGDNGDSGNNGGGATGGNPL